MPNIYIDPHNKIGYLFLILTVLSLTGIIFGLFSTSYGAKIIITPEPEEIDANLKIQISEDIITEDNQALTGQILETTQEAQEKNTVQATVSTEDYAEGEVILTNNTGTSINFIAGTRFSSPEGLIFRAVSKIRIPPKNQTTVLVKADKTGETYDLGPTTFTIPNLHDPYLKENILAKSEKSMTGGLKKTGIVMQTDIDQTIKKLKEELYNKGMDEIEQKLPEADLKIVVESKVLEQSCDAQAGDEKAEFTASVKLNIKAIAFKEKNLLDIAVNSLKEKVPSGKKLTAYEPSSLSYRLTEHNLAQGQAALEVQFRGYMTIANDHQILEKNHFQGISPEEIKNYLENFKEIKQVQIKLWPPLIIKKAPWDANKIEIVIKNLQ